MPPKAGDKLRSAAEFRRVFREGKAVNTPHLVVHTARRAGGGAGRYGLVVSRKVGGAVARNRVRRQTRAAVELAGGIAPGFDSVIVVKPGSTLKVQELSGQICQIMEDVSGRSRSKGSSREV